MGNYTLSREEREALYRERAKHMADMGNQNASIELKNVSAREVDYIDRVLAGKAIGSPLFGRDLETGKLKRVRYIEK